MKSPLFCLLGYMSELLKLDHDAEMLKEAGVGVTAGNLKMLQPLAGFEDGRGTSRKTCVASRGLEKTRNWV